jgi:hypothetical protein
MAGDRTTLSDRPPTLRWIIPPNRRHPMADVLMVLLFLAFTTLCVVYVGWCDRMVGPDPTPTASPAPSTDTTRDEVAA